MRVMMLLPIAAAFLFIGCESPEVKRARGAGRGADLGYRGSNVEIHGGAEPYYQTPQLIDSRYARPGDAKNGERLSRQ
jgi:hypothetical protein